MSDASTRGANLRAYLAVEQLIVGLDGPDPEAADVLRDLADPLWWDLTAEEQEVLRQRRQPSPLAAPTAEEPDPAGGTRLVLL